MGQWRVRAVEVCCGHCGGLSQ